MSHKQRCIGHCREHLHSRNLGYVFNPDLFSHYYNKFNGSKGNALSVAMRAADAMIENYKPAPGELRYYSEFFN